MKKNFSDGVTQVTRRKNEAAERAIRRYRPLRARAPLPVARALRIVPLGGQNGIGEKNMIVVEYENDAVILDCGLILVLSYQELTTAFP